MGAGGARPGPCGPVPGHDQFLGVVGTPLMMITGGGQNGLPVTPCVAVVHVQVFGVTPLITGGGQSGFPCPAKTSPPVSWLPCELKTSCARVPLMTAAKQRKTRMDARDTRREMNR